MLNRPSMKRKFKYFSLFFIVFSLFISCTPGKKDFQTDDIIEFLKIDPGQSSTFPIGDFFYAKSYRLVFKPDDKIHIDFNQNTNTLTLTPKKGYSGLRFIHFRNGKIPMILPVIVKVKTEVIFKVAVDEKDAEVFVMGNFNNWSRNSTPMQDSDGDGIYTASLFLDNGIYEYQFVVNHREFYDPENPVRVDNGFGYYNSLLKVESEQNAEIPKLYFLPGKNDDIISLAIDSPTQLTSGDIHVLLNNQIYPEENIHINGNTLHIDLKDCRESGMLRVVATVNHNPGNVITVWLKDGKPDRDSFIWQDAIIYSLMVDRFANGNRINDNPVDNPKVDRRANFQGGDFAGIIRKINERYFNKIGVNTIWISPINKTTDKAWQEYPEPHRFYTGYHGYWPVSPDETEPRFGTLTEFKQLVKAAHQHDLKILLDFVSNHTHIEHPYYQNHRDWFGTYDLPDGTKNIRRWDEYRLTTWFDTFLPSFDYENSAAAVDTMTDNAIWWMTETGIDGFRHDATKHVPYHFWRELTRKIKTEVSPNRNLPVYQIGETFGGDDLIKSYVNNGMLSSQFNANQYFVLRRLFTDENSDLNELQTAIEKSNAVYGYNNLMGNIIGSHDQIRIMGLLEGDITLSENGVERAFREPAIKVDKQSTYQKEQILFCYLLTIPGVPIVFYGDEFGMTGANDPDNRRMMRFDDELSAQEKAQLLVFSKLSKIRNQFACLRRGDYLNLYTDKNVMVYSRGDSDNRLIIAFNKCQKDKNIVISPPGWMTIPSLEPLIGTVTSDIEGGKVSLIIPALGYGILQIK